jgi:RNA polymerase sigma factor (sigma-70 family)
MMNPFVEERIGVDEERALVLGAQSGEAGALESLIRLHQPWIFNIVLRMVPDYHEAEDLCQDIILKCFVNLGSFRGDSRFRTWLYRIAVNYVISARESSCERSQKAFGGKAADDEFMERFLDQELADDKAIPHDLALLAQESRIKCMLAMLVCLNRKQRMVFILGEILSVGGRTASGLLGMSEASYRQTLSRSRRRLYNFLYDRCSLVNPGKPCSCERSVVANVNCGFIDPLHLAFGAGNAVAIRDLVVGARRRLDRIEFERCRELYRGHPLQESPDFSRKVLEILESEDFRVLLEAAPANQPRIASIAETDTQ